MRTAEMALRRTVTRLRKRWRHIRHRHIRVMRKLDQSKIDWIIRQKARGPNLDIACAIDISVRYVERIHTAYVLTGMEFHNIKILKK